MNWQSFIAEARRQAGPFLSDAIRHRREHPAIYAKANALAADYHEEQGHRLRARWHRAWRRVYSRRADATAEHQECALMMRMHDDG